MTTSKASGEPSQTVTTTKPEHDTHEQPTAANYTAGELPALPTPSIPAIQRGYPGMKPSYTQPDYYTAEQVRERDAMWQSRLDAIAASHCAQGISQSATAQASQPAVVHGEAVGYVRHYPPADEGMAPIVRAELTVKLPHGTKLFIAPPTERIDVETRSGSHSQPTDKPAGQAVSRSAAAQVTDPRPQVPYAVISAIQDYGDARADLAADTARNMGDRLTECSAKMGSAIETLRDWAKELAPEPATAGEPVLDAPASVHRATFGVGVSWRTVIDAAKRQHLRNEAGKGPPPTEQQIAFQASLAELSALPGETGAVVEGQAEIDYLRVDQYLEDAGYPAGGDARSTLRALAETGAVVERSYTEFYEEVCRRAEANMLRTGKLEGMHWAAMQEVRREWIASPAAVEGRP